MVVVGATLSQDIICGEVFQPVSCRDWRLMERHFVITRESPPHMQEADWAGGGKLHWQEAVEQIWLLNCSFETNLGASFGGQLSKNRLGEVILVTSGSRVFGCKLIMPYA